MPSRAARPCTGAGCRQLVRGVGSRCEVCRRKYEASRGTSADRGYSSDWQRLRADHLARHPHCEDCRLNGQLVEAKHVDHVKAHRGNETLRLDRTNLRSLCASCHSRKTVKQDGGFGRVGGGSDL
jgi:5-methylcytosine-specific restriction protein A